ncbi:MAG: Eco57I restriction-modification methylase domain-containing protein [Sulfuritalea sp.]|nr:Eco57I restriction-modification methylase domain-containing protein [Sulfuritalea sp.]
MNSAGSQSAPENGSQRIINLTSRQLNLDLNGGLSGPHSAKVAAAIEKLSAAAGTESRGAVFTRSEVVDFILDLVGYTEDKPLARHRLLEPSFGGGDFLLPAVRRLLRSWRAATGAGSALDDLGEAIQAVELHRETFNSTQAALIALLVQEGLTEETAISLADCWLTLGDFLLAPLHGEFDFVVGNPPYVRQELIPAPLLAEYRSRYQTMYDRADLYIPFIERSLTSLAKGGHLGFICADRWMKNRYGGPLRSLVAEQFHLKIHVDMVDTPAFHSDVIAYPAIAIISRETPGPTRIAHRPAIDRATLTKLAEALRANPLPKDCGSVRELARVTDGAEPWLLESSDQMALIRRIEQQFPTLEAAGCTVGIGVATGADQAFIGDFEAMDVEPDRKLPLVTTRDIASGEVMWRGQGVINPFADNGGLVDLRDYPRLRRYLEARQEVIANRHCAQKSPANWYRTIDRITPALARKPKLLIPDIKGEAHIVFEDGNLYPHHNLYFVTSDEWDLRALQAVLLSAVTRLFVATYSTRMRGGFLRFQAQYLRRLRLPHWRSVSASLRLELIDAATKRDMRACDRAAFKLYGLNCEEESGLRGDSPGPIHMPRESRLGSDDEFQFAGYKADSDRRTSFLL